MTILPDAPRVAVMPVGAFDADPVRAEYDAIVAAVLALGAELTVAPPVADEAGARQALEAFAATQPDLLLLIPLRGMSAPVMEAAVLAGVMPCLLWPVTGRFALPSSTLALGALREAARPVELLFAPPDNAEALARLGCMLRAATAYTRLRRSRVGVIGGLFPNLVACRYDPATVQAKLGVTYQPISFAEVRAARQAQAPDRLANDTLASTYALSADDAPALAAGLLLHRALQQLAEAHTLDAFAAECWTACPGELGCNPCLGFIDDSYLLACEGDGLLAAAHLIVRYLTGRRAYVGDLYDLDLDGHLTLIHCGGPASLAAGGEGVLGPSQTARDRGFETITCRPQLAPGPATLFRYYGLGCDQLHLAQATLTGCELSPNLTVKLTLAGDRWHFLEHCQGNHYLVVAGDRRAELRLLAKWLGITVFET